MKEIQVTMTELRQNLGRLVNQVAFGEHLVVLVAHGTAKAAIINVEELQRLKGTYTNRMTHKERFTAALATADRLRKRIRHWQTQQGVEAEDSTETLRRLREELDSGPVDLR
jgi:prevent-host-death family protein